MILADLSSLTIYLTHFYSYNLYQNLCDNSISPQFWLSGLTYLILYIWNLWAKFEQVINDMFKLCSVPHWETYCIIVTFKVFRWSSMMIINGINWKCFEIIIHLAVGAKKVVSGTLKVLLRGTSRIAQLCTYSDLSPIV